MKLTARGEIKTKTISSLQNLKKHGNDQTNCRITLE